VIDLVSVIIPVFNRDYSVVKSIRSVQRQHYREIEIIVVDDGSVPPLDLGEDIASDGRVKLVRLENNQGPSAARNAGVRASSGQWLAWLDSDDVWHPDKLSLQMAHYKTLGDEAEWTALATGFEYVHPTGSINKRVPVSSSDPLYFFAGCWFCPGTTVMLHQSLFERVGPYDETMRRLEDIDWFIRLAMAGGRLDVVPRTMATISVGPKPRYQTVRHAGNTVFKKYKNFSQNVTKSARGNLAAYLHLEYAASAIKRERHFIRGAYHLAASFMIRPRTNLQLYPFWNKPEF
jgi:glycosyltransferase involved in cell wall biosynthesis